MPRRRHLYIETDGQVFLVEEDGILRFPREGEPLPFAVEPAGTMRLGDTVVLRAKPKLRRHPEEWLGKDEVVARPGVHALAKHAVYMSLMRCVSEVLVPRGDTVLLVKARRGFSKGHWNLPGGFLDYGEHPEDAAVRETLEEIGITPRLTGIVGTYVSGFPGKPSHTLGIVYRGEIDSEAFRLRADEIEDARFWRIDAALTLTRNPFVRWALVDHFRSLGPRAAPLPVFTHRRPTRWTGAPRPILFLDRDGVINRSRPGYVKRPEEFEFLPGAVAALRSLTAAGWPMVIVSNQDVMAWKLIGHEGLRAVHRGMFDLFRAEGIAVENLYYCPHPLNAGCRCRKPRPGLLLAAARDLQAKASRSWMVGDKPSDIAAGNALGLRTVFIGSKDRRRRFAEALRDDPPSRFAPSLRIAVRTLGPPR